MSWWSLKLVTFVVYVYMYNVQWLHFILAKENGHAVKKTKTNQKNTWEAEHDPAQHENYSGGNHGDSSSWSTFQGYESSGLETIFVEATQLSPGTTLVKAEMCKVSCRLLWMRIDCNVFWEMRLRNIKRGGRRRLPGPTTHSSMICKSARTPAVRLGSPLLSKLLE